MPFFLHTSYFTPSAAKNTLFSCDDYDDNSASDIHNNIDKTLSRDVDVTVLSVCYFSYFWALFGNEHKINVG